MKLVFVKEKSYNGATSVIMSVKGDKELSDKIKELYPNMAIFRLQVTNEEGSYLQDRAGKNVLCFYDPSGKVDRLK